MGPSIGSARQGDARNSWRRSIHRFREAANSLCAESAAHVDEPLKNESRMKCEELRDIYLALLELNRSAISDELSNADTWREAMKFFDDVANGLDEEAKAKREASESSEGELAEETREFAERAKGLANEVRDVLRGLNELLIRSPTPPPSVVELVALGATKAEHAAERAETAAEKAEAAARKVTG
jgi:hypothetical protein